MPIIKTNDAPLVIKLPVGDDSGGKSLVIRYLTKDAMTAIRKRCLTRVLNKRSHQYEEEVDTEKWAQSFLQEAFQGFEALTWNDLNGLLEPASRFLPAENDPAEVMQRLIPATGPEFDAARGALLQYGRQSTLAAMIRTAADDECADTLAQQHDAEKKT